MSGQTQHPPLQAGGGKRPFPVLKGGTKEQLVDMLKKYAEPLNIYIGFLLILGIVYVGKIPDAWSYQANTLVGRLLLFTLTLLIAELYSWPYAVLMATFSVLVIAVSPRSVPVKMRRPAAKRRAEGFQDDKETDSDVKLVTQKKRWWSELVLGENPIGIEEDKVHTRPIQDASNSSTTSSTSIGR